MKQNAADYSRMQQNAATCTRVFAIGVIPQNGEEFLPKCPIRGIFGRPFAFEEFSINSPRHPTHDISLRLSSKKLIMSQGAAAVVPAAPGQKRKTAFNPKEANSDSMVAFVRVFVSSDTSTGTGGAYFHVDGPHGSKKARFEVAEAGFEANRDTIFTGRNSDAVLTEKSSLKLLTAIKDADCMGDELAEVVAELKSVETALKLQHEEVQEAAQRKENQQYVEITTLRTLIYL
jgi:hypothetical protein